MKLRSLRYLCGEGFKNVWANRLMSLASIGVLVACMLIMGVAVAFSINVDNALGTLEQQNVVMVFFDDSLGDEGARYATEQISKMDNISSAVYVPKDEGLQNQLEKMDENSEALFDYLDGENPLPNGAQVHFTDLSRFDETLEALQKVDGVTKVNHSRELAQKITTIRQTVNIAGTWIIILLLIISLVIISNTIRITMYSRKLEISIMKAVGATDGFIRFPFLVEGVVLGIAAAGLTTGLLYAVYRLAISLLETSLGVSAIPFRSFAGTLFLLFLFIGVVVGLVGSTFMITKYLRKEGSEFRAL
jgi:cell division transport system permease protein